jgi:hypothetical protein
MMLATRERADWSDVIPALVESHQRLHSRPVALVASTVRFGCAKPGNRAHIRAKKYWLLPIFLVMMIFGAG